MATADRDEAVNLARYLRFARLQRDVADAERADAARRRLEQRLQIDSRPMISAAPVRQRRV